MNRFGRAVVLLAVGASVGRLVADGRFGDFVQQRMRWPLIFGVIVVLGLALVDLIVGIRADEGEDQRPVGPAVGWLLIAPVVVLMSVAPAALGAAAASRVDAFAPNEPIDPLAPILPETDPFPMKVLDFLNLAYWDETGALEGREVILEGLVVNDPEQVVDGFVLIRFVVSCCAADGLPVQVAVRGGPTDLEDETWVRATVRWLPPEVPYQAENGPTIVEVEMLELEIMDDPPDSPYESPF